MAANEILPFAQGVLANVLSQAAYSAALDRTNGNQPGLASAELVNKAMLQSSVIAAALAQFIADLQATNVTDALTPSALNGLLKLSLDNQIRGQTFAALTTAGSGTAYTIAPARPITAYAAGQSFFVNFHAASGTSPTLTISGIGTPPNLVKQVAAGTYSNIASSDIPANHRSRVTLLSATQALVEKLPLAAGGPAFSAYKAANQVGIANNVSTKVTFTSEIFDTAGAYDTATSRFTPLIAGYYLVNMKAALSSVTTTNSLNCQIYQNGAVVAQGGPSSPSAAIAAIASVTALLYMNGSTDYLEGYVFGDCGAAFDLLGGSSLTAFNAVLVRAA
jgi:hypothetical protein